MTRSTIRTIFAAVLVAGAGLTACGSDGEKRRLSAEEFQAQGNAICTAGDAELQKEGQKLLGDGKMVPTPEALADFFKDEALPIARKKLDQLEKLEPPEKDEKAVGEMISAGREATEEVEEGLEENPAGFLAGRGPDPFAEFDEMAAELGLDECVGQQE